MISEGGAIQGLSQTYYATGSEVEPAFTLLFHGETLEEGRDYEVAYENNLYPGTGTIRIQGIGAFCGTLSRAFVIEKSSQHISNVPSLSVGLLEGAQKKLSVSAPGELSFVSMDESIATVDADGTVRGIKEGSTTIVITAAETEFRNMKTEEVPVYVRAPWIPSNNMQFGSFFVTKFGSIFIRLFICSIYFLRCPFHALRTSAKKRAPSLFSIPALLRRGLNLQKGKSTASEQTLLGRARYLHKGKLTRIGAIVSPRQSPQAQVVDKIKSGTTESKPESGQRRVCEQSPVKPSTQKSKSARNIRWSEILTTES